jgi:DNA-binding MarR family transcriptional regulator
MLMKVNLESEAVLCVLRLAGAHLNQRMISESLGFSLGKTNYLVRALIDEGLINAKPIAVDARDDKRAKYHYELTKAGLALRITLTEKFIELRRQEYEQLEAELAEYNSA